MVLVVDDDDLSRDVLAVLLEAEGYAVETAARGDEALRWLAARGSHEDLPDIVLTDLQMPGLAGNELALRLRILCGPSVRLIAMSAAEPAPALVSAYDRFLRKPFAVYELEASASDPRTTSEDALAAHPILDDAIHARLAATMSQQQLAQTYAFCIADAERRIRTMRHALQSGHEATFRKEAHTLQGGCGMLGAMEMRGLAVDLERASGAGKPTLELVGLLDGFLAASARLQRMLRHESEAVHDGRK